MKPNNFKITVIKAPSCMTNTVWLLYRNLAFYMESDQAFLKDTSEVTCHALMTC